MPNPLESMMLEGFRQFQSEQFARDTDDAYAQYNASLLQQRGDQYVQQLKQAEQESLSAHGRLGAAIDETFLLGGIKKGTTTALGVAGAVLGAPGRAVSGAALAGVEDRNIFEGAFEGFMNRREDVNFATVLEEAGMEDVWARNTFGFLLDVVLDPLNIFMFPKIATTTGGIDQQTWYDCRQGAGCHTGCATGQHETCDSLRGTDWTRRQGFAALSHADRRQKG